MSHSTSHDYTWQYPTDPERGLTFLYEHRHGGGVLICVNKTNVTSPAITGLEHIAQVGVPFDALADFVDAVRSRQGERE